MRVSFELRAAFMLNPGKFCWPRLERLPLPRPPRERGEGGPSQAEQSTCSSPPERTRTLPRPVPRAAAPSLLHVSGLACPWDSGLLRADCPARASRPVTACCCSVLSSGSPVLTATSRTCALGIALSPNTFLPRCSVSLGSCTSEEFASRGGSHDSVPHKGLTTRGAVEQPRTAGRS